MVPFRSTPHNQLIPAVDSATALSNISRCLFFRFCVNSRGKLRPISESDVSTLLRFFSFSLIRSNTVLLREGDTSNASLMVLVRGSIQCVNEAYEIGVMQKGDWLGGEAILQEACYYSAIALTDCVALTLSDHALKQMQTTAPLLAMSLKRLLKEVDKDKKSEDGMLRIVLPVGIGDCEVRPMTREAFAALFA